jgi:hypothetical protein
MRESLWDQGKDVFMSDNIQRNQAIFIGYFPKKTSTEIEWLDTKEVREICSVSNCISKAPLNWIDHWAHNTKTGLFDTEDSAWSVVESSCANYDMYAYKVYPRVFDRLTEADWRIEGVPEHLEGFEFLGFDIVSREPEVAGWLHSPLSCCKGCREFEVNAFCLIDDFENALACIKKIASDIADAGYVTLPDGSTAFCRKWEPGLYHLFEVYRKIRY